MENYKGCILAIEDEAPIRRILEIYLSMLGYEVVTACDGEEGLKVFHDQEPDLVLLDVMMPKLDGYGVCQTIREKSDVPIIMLTGLGDFADRITGLELGADDYVVKPFSPKELESRISTILSRKGIDPLKRYKKLVKSLSEENKNLNERINILSNKDYKSENSQKYRAICGLVAHSLKNEFMRIGSAVQFIEKTTEEIDEVQEDCFEIKQSIDYSNILLQKLLDYLDIGKPVAEQIYPTDLLNNIVRLAEPRLPSNVNLKTKISRYAKKLMILGNLDQLVGIVLELILNAKKSIEDRDGIIEIAINKSKNNIAIEIRDNGPGIPKDIRDKVFMNQIASEKNYGLGLLLCNKVANSLGGELKLKSSSKKGTSFLLIVPSICLEDAK